MKYVDSRVVFREVPEEISLAVNISGCPVKCPGCHSPYLTQDIGEILDNRSLEELIARNPGISCVSFMGGDADPDYLKTMIVKMKEKHPEMKVCWYSGRSLENAGQYGMVDVLDYIKVGPFIDECGPLDNPGTNQRFYRIQHSPEGDILTDWTAKFLKKYL